MTLWWGMTICFSLSQNVILTNRSHKFYDLSRRYSFGNISCMFLFAYSIGSCIHTSIDIDFSAVNMNIKSFCYIATDVLHACI